MALLTPQIPMYRQVDRSLGEPVSTPKRNETLKRTMEWQQGAKGAGDSSVFLRLSCVISFTSTRKEFEPEPGDRSG